MLPGDNWQEKIQITSSYICYLGSLSLDTSGLHKLWEHHYEFDCIVKTFMKNLNRRRPSAGPCETP